MSRACLKTGLRIGQPLQCDPTVAYALTLAGKYSGKLDGGDLHFASPYNTYQNKGLPPGPIANPGEAVAARGARSSADRRSLFCRQYRGRPLFQQDP